MASVTSVEANQFGLELGKQRMGRFECYFSLGLALSLPTAAVLVSCRHGKSMSRQHHTRDDKELDEIENWNFHIWMDG